MYGKSNQENNRLATDKLKLPVPLILVFISESLTPKMKKLFFFERDFAKLNFDYSRCWIAYRKNKERSIIAKNESNLPDISKQ